jgi:hypothetical protein
VNPSLKPLREELDGALVVRRSISTKKLQLVSDRDTLATTKLQFPILQEHVRVGEWKCLENNVSESSLRRPGKAEGWSGMRTAWALKARKIDESEHPQVAKK